MAVEAPTGNPERSPKTKGEAVFPEERKSGDINRENNFPIHFESPRETVREERTKNGNKEGISVSRQTDIPFRAEDEVSSGKAKKIMKRTHTASKKTAEEKPYFFFITKHRDPS